MKSNLLLVLATHTFYLSLCSHITVRVDPLVYIEQGLVLGEKVVDGDYSAFLGVPYAEVDLDKPFGPSLPAPQFDGIFKATDSSIKCPQTSSRTGSVEGSLDCLRLNIIVPSNASTKNPLPVLIWVHGGRFKEGSGEDVIAKGLVQQGIIVVGVNYRLGAYGFMCLDNPSVPGNQGLKDQLEAIRWVRKNIAAFGGNPYEVTIGGQSAGSCSMLCQLYAKNERLFNKVIAQSGTPLNDGMFVEKDQQAAIKIAAHLGYGTTDTEEALQFLSKTNPDLVVGAANELDLDLKPCKESEFENVDSMITENPLILSNDNKVRQVSIMIGHTSQEEDMLDRYDANKDPFYVKIRDNFNMAEEDIVKAAEIVRTFYIGDEELSEDLIPALADFDSDFTFAHSVHRTVTGLLRQNPIALYQYMFSYVGDSGKLAAPHSAELKYLFGDVHDNVNDRLIADRITTLWGNFVKYGNPTPQTTDLLPVTWEPVSNSTRPYLDLDTDLKLEHRLYKERMTFWDLFYDQYGQYHVFAQ